MTSDAIAYSSASGRLSSVVHQSQANGYYCGPATAAILIKARTGTSYSQSTMASSLRTTTDGTGWYDGGGKTGYPMPDTINSYIGKTFYAKYGTSIDPNTFKLNVMYDIDLNYGLAGNAYEVVGGPHLVGHPNEKIYHWFAIDGYANYGDTIWYVDPVAGCSAISWSSSVPPYSSMNYKTLATIIDGRGLIW
ncbi:C39 family peptidase [Clostridium sp.]|uniref:C39 family peptidase n=1 Tax=Clostridium sp. TaxID=1506 RepID=UPI0032167B6B